MTDQRHAALHQPLDGRWRRAWAGPLVAWAIAALALASCGGGADDADQSAYQPQSPSRVLATQPIAQQTEVWCWAASAEMVFRHYGLPDLNPAGNFQCGIVAAYYGPATPCWSNCFACITPISSMSEIQRLVNGYGLVANQFTPSRVLSSVLALSPLGFADVAREIDGNRPILAGISPTSFAYPNFPQHAVVIVGYATEGGMRALVINDPFPYDLFPASPNPYLFAGGARRGPGQYVLPYDAAIASLRWGSTVYRIQ